VWKASCSRVTFPPKSLRIWKRFSYLLHPRGKGVARGGGGEHSIPPQEKTLVSPREGDDGMFEICYDREDEDDMICTFKDGGLT
jgi:hypothetical protein